MRSAAYYSQQAQIKAGIIHAIFSKDVVLETLANEKWTRKKGGSISFGLGGFAEFKSLADALQNTVDFANISNIDSGSFEKIIDDFAAMVGEEEFYLRVGGILKTKSAFLGHTTHDPAHEHIEAKERQNITVEEHRESYDHSFDLSVGDLMTVVNTIKQQIKDEAIADGITREEAEEIAEESKTALQEVSRTVEDTNTTLQEIDEHEKAAVQDKIVEVPDDSPVALKRQAQRENLNVLSSSVRNAAQRKIHALNQQIATVEAQKASISEKLRQTPGVKETVTTVLDSLIDGLKSTRDYCTYVVHNPLEAIERTYNVTTVLGGMAVDKVLEAGRFAWNHPSEALDLTRTKLSAMYNFAKDDVFGVTLDAAEYMPFGIGSLVEGGRDVHGVWFAKNRDLRSVTDKWRNFGFLGLIGGKGAKKAAKEIFEVVSSVGGKYTAKLTRYGGSGGGHHIHMKKAYESHPLYNLNEALCLSNKEMMRLGINHLKVTTEQRRLCIELNKAGKTLTRKEMNRISVEALVAGGANEQLARDIVARSQWDLRSKGVRNPTNQPFMRNKK